MNTTKIHIGMMLFTERAVNEIPTKSKLAGKYELLLLDGREINTKKYPVLAKMLEANGLGNKLPNETQDLDIQDHYVVARRLNRKEIMEIKAVLKDERARALGGNK